MGLPIEHAIGQKMVLSFIGTAAPAEFLTMLSQRHIGGVTLFRHDNIVNPSQVRALTAQLQKAAQAAGQPPLLITIDQEGGQFLAIDGGTTRFPGNLALGATGSVDLAHKTGYALGRELAAMGINVNYAPVCDVNINPENPVIGIRSFGESPEMVARMAAAMIEGMQSAGVAATAKHFPGHGDATGDSHYGITVVPHSRERLKQVELPPFIAAINAGVRLIMTAHVALPAIDEGGLLPATLSRAILRGLLREELGFDGLIVSDAMDMKAITQGMGLIIDAIAATAAGVDMLLLKDEPTMYEQVYAGLLQATKNKLVARDDVVASAERVLALKRWLASQEQPPFDVVGCAEHRALASEIAARSITLVRDDAGLLPLRPSSDARLIVVLPQPVDLTPADTSSFVTCTLADAVRRYHPTTDEIVFPAQLSHSDIPALKQRVSGYDMVIVGTINAATHPGQAALVNEIVSLGIPTVVVALRVPYDLAMYPAASTYLCSYSILEPSMEALAQVLWGHIPPVGKLPASIAGLYPRGHGLSSGKQSA